MNDKKYVYIHSNKTIVVMSNVSYDDLTKYDSDIKDRLKIHATMVSIMIHEGRHSYPKVITEWNTVKALVADKVLTIGEETDDAPIHELGEGVGTSVVDPTREAEPVKEEAPKGGKKVKVVESLDDIAQ